MCERTEMIFKKKLVLIHGPLKAKRRLNENLLHVGKLFKISLKLPNYFKYKYYILKKLKKINNKFTKNLQKISKINLN